jgi:hypothetical protein
MTPAPPQRPALLARARAALAPERLDLVIVGVLLVAALLVRCHIAWQHTPGLLHAIGPDHDDWEGVFLGARHSWPPTWDFEWQRRYPLLPVLAVALGRGAGLPTALAAQWVCMLVSSLVAPFTYAIGLRTVGRSAALAAAGWMVFHDGLTTYGVLTTAYGVIPTAYLALVLGLAMGPEGRWAGRALAAVGALLLSAVILQGAMLVLLTLAAALLAFGLATWRQPGWLRGLWGALWPGLLGVLASLPLLARSGERAAETPLGGAFRLMVAEVHLTLLHSEHFGPPTGHKVHRLLNGTPRLEHIASTIWEQLWLPAWLLLPLVGLGAWLMLRSRAPGGRGGRLLLLALLAGPLYGFVANSEDFHVFQWFPGLALVICAGLLGWTRWLPWLLPRRVLALGIAAGFLALQGLVLPDLRDVDAGRLHGRVRHFVGATQAWELLADQAVGPISGGGTLLVDDADVWAHRGLLMGRASLAEMTRVPDGVADVASLPAPIVLITPHPPERAPGRLAGSWELTPLQRFRKPKPYWLYLLRPTGSVSGEASTLHGVWSTPDPPAGTRLRVEVMGLPDDGGGVFGVVHLLEPGAFTLPLERTPARFNLWIFVDNDGDGDPDYHLRHPASPFDAAPGPEAPLDLGLRPADLTQVFPDRPPSEPASYYIPGGRPVWGELTLEGPFTGCVQIGLRASVGGRMLHEAAEYRFSEGPFRIDAPAGAETFSLLLRQDTDGDGAWERIHSPVRDRPLPPEGLQGLRLDIAEADWIVLEHAEEASW